MSLAPRPQIMMDKLDRSDSLPVNIRSGSPRARGWLAGPVCPWAAPEFTVTAGGLYTPGGFEKKERRFHVAIAVSPLHGRYSLNISPRRARWVTVVCGPLGRTRGHGRRFIFKLSLPWLRCISRRRILFSRLSLDNDLNFKLATCAGSWAGASPGRRGEFGPSCS